MDVHGKVPKQGLPLPFKNMLKAQPLKHSLKWTGTTSKHRSRSKTVEEYSEIRTHTFSGTYTFTVLEQTLTDWL